MQGKDVLIIHHRDGTETRVSEPFQAMKEVDLFLRIHGHLPDRNCGAPWAFGKCKYSTDGEPINAANDYVEKLRKDPEYVKREKSVQEAQTKWQAQNNHA